MAYTPPEYFTLADAEARHGVNAVAQLFDDDGNGSPDATAVEFAIREASAEVDAFLFGKFGKAVIDQLKDDYRFKGCCIDVFMAIAGERRTEFAEFRQAGSYPHMEKRKRARDTLDSIGKGITRLGAENEYGTNPTLAGRTSVALPVVHVFAPSAANPRGSGGF